MLLHKQDLQEKAAGEGCDETSLIFKVEQFPPRDVVHGSWINVYAYGLNEGDRLTWLLITNRWKLRPLASSF